MNDAEPRQRALVDVRVVLVTGARVFLLRRSDPLFAGFWNLPGGHVLPDEDALSAAVREVREEAGVRVRHADLRFVGVSHYRPPTRAEKISFCFRAEVWSGEAHAAESQRTDGSGWFPVDALPGRIMPQAAEAVRLYRCGAGFSTYGLGRT